MAVQSVGATANKAQPPKTNADDAKKFAQSVAKANTKPQASSSAAGAASASAGGSKAPAANAAGSGAASANGGKAPAANASGAGSTSANGGKAQAANASASGASTMKPQYLEDQDHGVVGGFGGTGPYGPPVEGGQVFSPGIPMQSTYYTRIPPSPPPSPPLPPPPVNHAYHSYHSKASRAAKARLIATTTAKMRAAVAAGGQIKPKSV